MTPPVIDAHHHLWDPAEADYPWMTEAVRPIIRRFAVEDLAPLLPVAGVDGTVVVQARHDLAETRALLATAAVTPFIAGVVGWVDLTADDVAGTIDALRAGPGGDRLVGIRHQVHDEPDAEWLSRRDVRRGLAAVEAAGLAYDLLIRPREFPAARAIVEDLPDLRFVIDHLAKPPIRGGATEVWAAGLRSFGARPNVWCKLSGLVTEADWATWTVRGPGAVRRCRTERFRPGPAAVRLRLAGLPARRLVSGRDRRRARADRRPRPGRTRRRLRRDRAFGLSPGGSRLRAADR